MESLLNYLALISKNGVGRLVTMATKDHRFLGLQSSKVNFNGLIMQLEQFFFKLSVFSDRSYLNPTFRKVI